MVFDVTADYTAQGPEAFLKGYQGYLQAEALAPYEGLYGTGQVWPVGCWAHARRTFVAAAEASESLANVALEWIRQLYALERELPPLLLPSDDPVAREQRRQREVQRHPSRQPQAEPVLAELKQWLNEPGPQALPKSALGQADRLRVEQLGSVVPLLGTGVSGDRP